MNLKSALIAAFLFLLSIQSNAAEFGRVSADMKISATIINVTQMPTDEAIRFCDDHNLPCEEIRAKALEEGYTDAGQMIQGTGWTDIREGEGVVE